MTKKEVNKLDKLAERKCKEDKEYRCEICGRSKDQGYQIHHHHFYGRRIKATRWVLDNLFSLCASCHTMGLNSAHENPEWFRGMAISLRGQKWFNSLKKLSVKINKKSYLENVELMDKSVEEILRRY